MAVEDHRGVARLHVGQKNKIFNDSTMTSSNNSPVEYQNIQTKAKAKMIFYKKSLKTAKAVRSHLRKAISAIKRSATLRGVSPTMTVDEYSNSLARLEKKIVDIRGQVKRFANICRSASNKRIQSALKYKWEP